MLNTPVSYTCGNPYPVCRDDHISAEPVIHPLHRFATYYLCETAPSALAKVQDDATVMVVYLITEVLEPLHNERRDASLLRPNLHMMGVHEELPAKLNSPRSNSNGVFMRSHVSALIAQLSPNRLGQFAAIGSSGIGRV
jgi:hypothetical protein